MSLSPSQHGGWTCSGDLAHGTDAVALGGVKGTDFMVYDGEQSAAGIREGTGSLRAVKQKAGKW